MKRFYLALGEDRIAESKNGPLVLHADAMDELTKFARVWAKTTLGMFGPIGSFAAVRDAMFPELFPGFRLVGDSVETCRVGEVK